MNRIDCPYPVPEAPKSECIKRSEAIKFGIDAEASFEFDINEEGAIVCPENEKESEKIVQNFSRLKFGCNEAAEFFAESMAQDFINRIESDSDFKSYLEAVRACGESIFITGPGSRNVSSASDNLLQKFAARINIYLSKHQLPTVITRTMSRRQTGSMDYASMTQTQRQQRKSEESPSRSFIPAEFKDQHVFYVDDIFITGTVANSAKQRIGQAGAKSLQFFFATKASPEAVKTGAKIEHKLNTVTIKGRLEDIEDIVNQSDFFLTQKLLRIVLDPNNRELLKDFLQKIPRTAVQKIYEGASGNDFRWTYEQQYRDSVQIIETFLSTQTQVSQAIEEKEDEPTRVSTFKLTDRESLTTEARKLYSRMKHSDPEAVAWCAEHIVQTLLERDDILDLLRENSSLVITSSAFGAVPTAADLITQAVIDIFRERHDISFLKVKIDRAGDFANTAYGGMSQEERDASMAKRKISLSKEAQADVDGAVVLILDDIRVTGSHEKALHELLKQSKPKEYVFCYLAEFTGDFAEADPAAEDFLNHSGVNGVKDLLPFFNRNYEGTDNTLRVNARTIKFILATDPDHIQDVCQEEKIENLKYFFSRLNDDVLEQIFLAATSSDGYGGIKKFQKGLQILEAEVQSRPSLGIDLINRQKNRITAVNMTKNSDGTWIDMLTGESMHDEMQAYSLMKFGCPASINHYATKISTAFMQALEKPESPLKALLVKAKANQEHICLMVPGSRNVNSSSNFVLEKAIETINISLALQGLPTVAVIQTNRLASNAANYASLPKEERQKRDLATKSILPGQELFQHGVHLLFGDDVIITGSTAERVQQNAKDNGALESFSLYGVVVDPQLAANNPAVESEMNHYSVPAQTLGQEVISILSQAEFQPVQRLIRLLLSQENRAQLPEFLALQANDPLIVQGLKKVYVSALNNDYLTDEIYSDSIYILQEFLEKQGD